MDFRVFLLACTAAFFYTPAVIAETSTEMLIHDGKERTYLLSVPEAAAKRGHRPLVIALHPYPSSGRDMAELSKFSELAAKEGFVVAYPDGINGGFNAMICCGDEDDVGFIKAIIEKVSKAHAIDRSRIYAAGISNGADLTYRLAVQLPGIFAAIAPVSGGMTGDWMKKTSGNLPETPVSLITFYGKRDKYQPVFDVGSKFWFEKLDCRAAVSTLPGTDIEVTEGTCSDGSSAKKYVLPDMGHAWPGGMKGYLAYPTAPIDATQLIWQFFKAHPSS